MSQVELLRAGLAHAAHRLDEITGRLRSLEHRASELYDRLFYTLAASEDPDATSARMHAASAKTPLLEAVPAARNAAERTLMISARL